MEKGRDKGKEETERGKEDVLVRHELPTLMAQVAGLSTPLAKDQQKQTESSLNNNR
jgi:hypothetical protein